MVCGEKRTEGKGGDGNAEDVPRAMLGRARSNTSLERNLLRSRCQGAAILVVYVFLPVASRTIFGLFQCEAFDGGYKMLVADYSVSCNTDTYTLMYSFAITMLIIWPVGVPLCFSVILFSNRTALVGGDELGEILFLPAGVNEKEGRSTKEIEDAIFERRDEDASLNGIRLLFDT